MKLIFLLILCLSAILCLPGCKSRDMYAQPCTQLELPLSSKAMATYYYLKKPTNFFFLKPEYARHCINFTPQEASVRLHSNRPEYVETEWCYYEAGRFFKNENAYAIILYNYPGEFDDPYLNVQLNGYNANGELLDALVLDTRYRFEDVEGFAEYIIEDDIVTINEYVGIFWDADAFDNDLNMVVLSNPVYQLHRVKTYEIEDGYFILLTEEEYSVSFINKSRDAD